MSIATPEKNVQPSSLRGLSSTEVSLRQQQYGKNRLQKEKPVLPQIVIEAVKEPMFLLLVLACTLYFVLGEKSEGLLMAVAILIVTAISVYQGVRSTHALKALKDLTSPQVKVVRDETEVLIPSEDLVPGDIMLLEEGERLPADALFLHGNDCSVNEAIITGESLPVEKSSREGSNLLFQGAVINAGKCAAEVTATGNRTTLGKIGKTIEQYSLPATPLQQAVSRIVKRLAAFGVVAFLLIWLINSLKTGDIVSSLLVGLTLAMAAIPEEIPVAFSSFMALGAFRMSKRGIISRQPQVIENLGAISVICLDKTGTITENKMEVNELYNADAAQLLPVGNDNEAAKRMLYMAMLASEEAPFDEMEKGIWRAYNKGQHQPGNRTPMAHEYPLQGSPPMMTHVYATNSDYLAAAKGAPERIFRVCGITGEQQQRLLQLVKKMAAKGQRVIAVAAARHTNLLPLKQEDFNWQLEGLIGLYDPPKAGIGDALFKLQNAGISVKLLTGDFPETAINIATQVGLNATETFLTGEEVTQMNEEDLQRAVKETVVFARMFPEAKLRVVEALKANGNIVAMTGDGVNDGPALKAADVGIAMGRRGTQIARQAADIVLTDDNLQHIAEAIRQGRKIFLNLKKAIRYILSIHIPIILTASLPLLLGWTYPNIFTPVHVIFLELIMGPTCSIFYENEPEEPDSMQRPPRRKEAGLFQKKEWAMGVMQGFVITAGVLGLYYYFMEQGATLSYTRTVVFTTLIISNIFLTFVNRSFTDTIIKTIRYRNSLAPVVLVVSLLFLLVIHFVPVFRQIFGMVSISSGDFLLCIITAFLSVAWFEVFKAVSKKESIRVR